jgi:hypothetical protein
VEAITVLPSGNVGIGTTAPTEKLQVNGLIKIPTATATDNNSPGLVSASDDDFLYDGAYINQYGFGFHANSAMGIYTVSYISGFGGIELFTGGGSRMVIGSTGNVGIGITAPTYKLQLNGQPAANGYTAWTNYSDIRLKENVRGLDDGMLGKIMKLKPSTFNYNDKYFEVTGYDKDKKNLKLAGFIAQDLEGVFPEMVTEQKIAGESYLDSNLTNLQIYLVKAVQEQQAQIELLKQEIAELKKR